MDTHTTIAELREQLRDVRQAQSSIGLVPTMGNLHEGHLKLVRSACSQCDFVVTSIFVNPLQFGAGEDLQAYPRTPQEDTTLLTDAGSDVLFMPAVEEIYGAKQNQQSTVQVPELSTPWCGQSRPGHFDGVATVVCKLFNIVQPDTAFFGLKDYQQFLVISKMVADLSMPVRIQGIETERDAHGLALSSRNNYLNPSQLLEARNLYQSLQACAEAIRDGARDYSALEQTAVETLRQAGLKEDYFAICNAQTLQPASTDDRDLVILVAAFVGPSRLIDNLRLKLD